MKRLITFCIISFGMLTASMAAEKHPADYVCLLYTSDAADD